MWTSSSNSLKTGNLRYRLLGSVALCDGSRLKGKHRRTVLAALLLDANHVVSDDYLIDVLWGDVPPSSARGQLQVRIWELRKLLGRAVIVRKSPGYLIEVQPGELDLEVFDNMVTEARRELTAGRAAEGVDGLRAALELWHGAPLGGVTDALGRARLALDELRMTTLEELYAAELSLDRHFEVLHELSELCREYPFRERLQAVNMRALRQANRLPEALAVYEEIRRRLDSELGIEPGPELQQVYLDLVTDQEEGTDPAEPMHTAAVARPAELPYAVPRFAGRLSELKLLDASLPDERANGTAPEIWVVHGTAGVGKTAMVVHWAWRVRHRFPDGQLYLDLRGFDHDNEPLTPSLALGRLLRSLGTDPQRIPTAVNAQAGLFRSLLADRRALLVLDNVRDSAQVLPLLPPTGMVLVTSRHRLTELVVRVGARSLSLAPLAPEDSLALLTATLGSDQVSAERDAAHELARLCGHLPIALRIAAANLLSQPAPKIADLVATLSTGSRLEELTIDGAELGAVTRAFDASYRALPPQSRRIFRLLALLPGADFTPDAAAAATGLAGEAAARALAALTAVNLLERHAPGRFRFHDLVREYAYGRALAEETGAARDEAWLRVVEFFIATCEAAAEQFGPMPLRLPRERQVAGPGTRFTDVRSAVAWLGGEYGNLVATLRLAIAQGPFPEAWYLADAVRILTHAAGMWAPWLNIADDILEAARRSAEPRLAALIMQSIGVANVYVGTSDQAISSLRAAVDAHSGSGWTAALAAAVNALGVALQGAGRVNEAIEHYRSAVLLHRTLGNRIGEMMALGNLGYAYRQVGRLGEAIEVLESSLALATAEDSRSGMVAALVTLGFARQLQGRTSTALECLSRARDISREQYALYGESFALSGMSLVLSDLGEYRQGRDDALASLELARRAQHSETEMAALNALGRAETGLGLADQARDHLEEAVAIARRVKSPWGLAEAMAGLCALHGSTGAFDAAIAAGAEALSMARTNGLRPLEARSSLELGLAHLATGDAGQAKEQIGHALVLAQEHGFRGVETRARALLDDIVNQ
ncbi:BTAD domain-containing putative transcriptional regulator [Microtetraspora sp. NBRC 16547]|uniref:AfsR/SARP family transcriptional regulator n=1 Tax=Microtetraspora sp. NBRC 16547 TaxID=3030993 RepID=UPI00255635E3|nr:BTAD domain-containing putative transcriptional regulator [Microtetraspora sp. NBRC 16547]